MQRVQIDLFVGAGAAVARSDIEAVPSDQAADTHTPLATNSEMIPEEMLPQPHLAPAGSIEGSQSGDSLTLVGEQPDAAELSEPVEEQPATTELREPIPVGE